MQESDGFLAVGSGDDSEVVLKGRHVVAKHCLLERKVALCPSLFF